MLNNLCNQSKDKSYIRYKNLFADGNKSLSTAGVLIEDGNLESGFSCIKKAMEKYFTGYIFYEGWKAKSIHGVNDIFSEAILCNNVFEKFRLLCESVREYCTDDEGPVLIPSKLNKEGLEKVLNETKELARLMTEWMGDGSGINGNESSLGTIFPRYEQQTIMR